MIMNAQSSWSLDRLPSQAGRVAIVTGANSGLGFETARMLAGRGAEVILACRDRGKGDQALRRIREAHPGAAVSILPLDLADLDDVHKAAETVLLGRDRLDLLINNAGVMVPPASRTRQGFELQVGTNHLGHFALTVRLLPLLLRTAGARVVVVSSAAANFGRLDLDDLNYERRAYSRWGAYNQSKLATLVFALELSRRLAQHGCTTTATVSHPGGAATESQRNARFFRTVVNRYLAAPPVEAALTTLRAATDPAAANGSYWGPSRFLGMRGPPDRARVPRRAWDLVLAERLWAASEELTGVRFQFATPEY